MALVTDGLGEGCGGVIGASGSVVGLGFAVGMEVGRLGEITEDKTHWPLLFFWLLATHQRH